MSAVFHRFVPGSARGLVDDDGPSLLSGQVLQRYAARIDAPVIEITARRASAIVGFLRACKHEDAVVVVGVPGLVRARSPRSPGLARDGVLHAAEQAGYDGPLVLVARASVVDVDGDDTRLRERIARDVEAGYTSIGISAGALHDADEWARVAPVLAELDLGIELEIGADDDAALLLAQVDDLELPISAVRGAGLLDEIGKAVRVVEVRELSAQLTLPLRVCIDGLIKDEGDDDTVEARAWMATTRALARLQGRDTATRLEDVANRAGVSTGTLYLYFPTKEDLFRAVLRQGLLPNLEAMEQAVAADQGPAPALLRQIATHLLQVLDTNLTAIPKLVLAESGNFPAIARMYADEVVKRAMALLTGILCRGMERGELRQVDPQSAIPSFIAPFLMMALWKHSLGQHTDIAMDPRAIMETHMDLLLRGLEPRP